MQRLLLLTVLTLLGINCVTASGYIRPRSSPSAYNDVPRSRVTSLLQQVRSPSSGAGVLPMVERLHQAKTQRRAMMLGSRLEPVAGEAMSPGVKAMRYGRRSQTINRHH